MTLHTFLPGYILSLPQPFVRLSASLSAKLDNSNVLELLNIGIFWGHSNRKLACGTMIVICLGTICATGLGFCLVVVLSA